MDDKQINKWLRRRFRPLCWSLVGYYVLMNLMVSLAMLGDVIMGYLRALASHDFGFVPDMDALAGNA